MDRRSLDELKRRISLLSYLEQHGWRPHSRISDRQLGGLCPLHAETRPSFIIHTGRNLFYCHGCGQGGDLIRLVELREQLSFPAAVAKLRALEPPSEVVTQAAGFYQSQLARYPAAVAYLRSRGIHDERTIHDLGIGYAPGACLRACLGERGYGEPQLRAAGLLNRQGRDTLYRRITFPCEGNLYGRSIDPGWPPHRFLTGSKGGLFRWNQLRTAPRILLVEGALDVAALYQAGFAHATCGWGTHLNPVQLGQLSSAGGEILIAFDADDSGRRASGELARQLQKRGRHARIAHLPEGHDPASYLTHRTGAGELEGWLEEAEPWVGS